MTKRYLETISRKEAVRRILKHIRPMEDPERIPVYHGRGRITSGPVYAVISNPPNSCAAMDGYAVNYELTIDADVSKPVRLRKLIDVFPVNTGEPLPEKTDAVIMKEDVEEGPSSVTIRKSLHLWQHVRLTGEDVIEGDMLLPSRYQIGPLDIGLLISAGVKDINVLKKPSLLIIPTGREIFDIFKDDSSSFSRGMLIDSNSYTLKELAEGMGFAVIIGERTHNDIALQNTIFEGTSRFDVVAVIAGSSAGTEDYTERIITKLGKLVFHGISVMPGKPALFGVVNNKPVFGIPGYPVSAVMSFKTLMTPVVEKMLGTKESKKTLHCVTPVKIPSHIGMEESVRVSITKKGRVYYALPLPRGASIFSSLARADGIVVLPQGCEGFEENRRISCELVASKSKIDNRIHIVGSHDLSLDILREMIARGGSSTELVSTHVGSEGGIFMMKRGISDLCTTHILDKKERTYNVVILKKHLPDRKWKLVHLAKRMQGLLIQKGNPKHISGLKDLVRKDVRFINRQFGSGTRILLDIYLGDNGLRQDAICGYEREESSHTAVAMLVRDNVADCGIAVYAVAKIFSLDFIPLAEEDYELVVTEEFTKTRKYAQLSAMIRSEEFKRRLDSFGGYNTENSGKITYAQG